MKAFNKNDLTFMKNLCLKRWLKVSAVTAVLFMTMLFAVSPPQPDVNVKTVSSASEEVMNWASIPSAYAQEDDLAAGGRGLAIPEGEVEISPTIPKRPFSEVLLSMVNYFIGFLGFLATLAFVYAGVLWILSGGSEEMITKSKKIMTYAGLGIVVVILSYSAVTFITRSVPEGEGVVTEECLSDADCPEGSFCIAGQCTAFEEEEEEEEGGITGGPTEPATEENLDNIDDLMEGLEGDLDISNLSDEDQDVVNDALDSGANLDEKISNIEDLMDERPDLAPTLEKLIDGMERLKLIREELDELGDNMPRSKETVDAYEEASEALDNLMDDPTNFVKYNRFDTKYRKLKELIRKFPVVQARIRAIPGEGNVPFSVQFDGLDSIDPTGGTIGEYRWSYLDRAGNEVLIGSEPVVVHEFTETGTYAVRLRASTTQTETDPDTGETYKTAMDGVSIVHIKANPPASEVRFRINGAETFDVFHVTLEEAQAGLSFDPSPTTPALGRTIEKYEWFYGDGMQEVRLVPTTVVHTYNKAGEYFVKLVVTDNLGVKDSKIVKLFVKSLAADIKINPSTGDVNTEFTFIGIGSRSDDGVIRNFQWEIHDEDARIIAESEESSFTHRFDRPGTYKIILVVTDITGARDKIVKDLKVASRPPVASFNFSIPQQNHPNQVEFNAVDSYDPDEGDLITYSWDFDGDGDFEIAGGTDALVTHEYSKVGEYRAKLQVEDSFEKRNQVEKKVSVKSILSGDIVADRLATRVGEPIEFSALSPNAVAYLWEFGDGETESTEETTVSHTYNKAGRFTVKMNFFDDEDNENFDTRNILVGAAEEPLAVIDYLVGGRQPRMTEDLCGEGQEGTVVTRADLIRFNARNSINTDGSSRLLSYDWRFPNGEKSSSKEVSFKFDEINLEGECFSVSLAVRDQITGKLSKTEEAFFKVINQLPEITDFVITPPDVEELVTPLRVQLKAVNSKDSDGTIKKYRWWYFREGFEDERLGVHNTVNPETEMVITSFGEPGVTNRYFFALEIVDNDNGVFSSQERYGEVSYLDVENGPNLSPVAEFTMDKTTISVGDSITFVSQSYDPQGEVLPTEAFRWDFDGDGEFDDVTSGPQVNRQYNTPGEYNVRLRVVHRGLSSSVTKAVFVESTESLPQAAFTYKIEGNDVTFDGSHSRYDPTLEDITLRFEWDFDVNSDADGNGVKDDDVQSTEMNPTFTYPETLLYKVKLTVKDFMGMEGVVVRDVDLSLTEAERQRRAYRSLQVSAPKFPLTTLDIEVIPATLEKGGTADIEVRVLNADGSPYVGSVFFEVLEGSGQFFPNPVEAEDSKASSVFSSLDEGKVRIRVRATETLYGELIEEATITVK